MKSLTRGRNCDNPFLIDLALCNNDDLVLDVSVLPPLGEKDHSLNEMHVRCDINTDSKISFYDYKNTNFDMICSVFNSDFHSRMNNVCCEWSSMFISEHFEWSPSSECSYKRFNFTNTAPVKLNDAAKSNLRPKLCP